MAGRKYRRKFKGKKKAGHQDKLIFYIGLCFTIGILIGSVYAFLINTELTRSMVVHTENMVSGAFMYSLDKSSIFRQCLLKYGKTVLLIWLVTLISYGNIAVFAIIALKGASIGFSTGILIRLFDLKGIWYAGILYLPQTIIVLTAYFFLIYFLLRQSINAGNDENGYGRVIFLVVSLAGVFLGSFFEAYISPGLIYAIL